VAPKLSLRLRATAINEALAGAHPDARVMLDHRNALELLVATILAAQCTDKKVNEVTPALFKRYRTAEDFARADPAELEAMIRPTGFFRQKTKSILAASRDIVEQFGGRVPDTIEDLTRLHGVGRKTANVVLGAIFGQPAIIVDTHFRRVAGRLGLTASDDPDDIERDVQKILPAEEWTAFSHRITFHGRRVCFARKPNCPGCVVNHLCPSAFKV